MKEENVFITVLVILKLLFVYQGMKDPVCRPNGKLCYAFAARKCGLLNQCAQNVIFDS